MKAANGSSPKGLQWKDAPLAYLEPSGKDASTSQITINKITQSGVTPDDIRRIVRETAVAEHELSAADQEKLDGLGSELGLTQDAIANFFRILGQGQVAPDKLIKTLAEIADQHQSLIRELLPIRGDDPEITALCDQARQAIEAGDYEQAKARLKQARHAVTAAAEKLYAPGEGRLAGGLAMVLGGDA